MKEFILHQFAVQLERALPTPVHTEGYSSTASEQEGVVEKSFCDYLLRRR